MCCPSRPRWASCVQAFLREKSLSSFSAMYLKHARQPVAQSGAAMPATQSDVVCSVAGYHEHAIYIQTYIATLLTVDTLHVTIYISTRLQHGPI